MSVNTRFADFTNYMPDAGRATDEDPRTFWVAASNEAGQILTVDLGARKTLRPCRSISPTH
ncbi:MAG TPA: hypothetical protein VGC23_00925 [Vicinamibacterales bacterium]